MNPADRPFEGQHPRSRRIRSHASSITGSGGTAARRLGGSVQGDSDVGESPASGLGFRRSAGPGLQGHRSDSDSGSVPGTGERPPCGKGRGTARRGPAARPGPERSPRRAAAAHHRCLAAAGDRHVLGDRAEQLSLRPDVRELHERVLEPEQPHRHEHQEAQRAQGRRAHSPDWRCGEHRRVDVARGQGHGACRKGLGRGSRLRRDAQRGHHPGPRNLLLPVRLQPRQGHPRHRPRPVGRRHDGHRFRGSESRQGRY